MPPLEALRLAVEHHQAGRFAAAAVGYRTALAALPGDPGLLKALGTALQESGAFGEAADTFEQALAAAPNDAAALSLRANALLGLGRAAEAVQELRLALVLAPQSVGAQRGLARALLAAGDAAEAAEAYERLLRLAPQEASSWCEYGVALARADRPDDARRAFAESLTRDPADAAGAGQQLARLDGGALAQDYVARHFDAFAGEFERKLVDVLKYDGPRLLREVVEPLLPCDARRMLDLGCGTGLCGVAFAELVEEIDGVDLAPRMVEAARGRGVYRRLACGDALAMLGGFPPGYDLAVAGDVLIYVGDPDPWLAALRTILSPGGLFAFTIETGEAGGYALADTLRYRHAPDFIEARLSAHGFALAAARDAPLRREAGRPVDGRVVVARRAA